LILQLGLALVVVLLLPTLAFAGNEFRQSKAAVVCCSQDSLSVTAQKAVLAGSTLALSIFSDQDSVTVSSINVSRCHNNTFMDSGVNLKGPNTPIASPTHGQMFAYYAKNTKPGPCTATVTLSGSVGVIRLELHEITGADKTAPLDQVARNWQSAPGTETNAVTTTAKTTTTDGQYIFAAMATISKSNPSAGSGFIGHDYDGDASMSEHQIQRVAGPIAATFTQKSEGVFINSVMMTFKAADKDSLNRRKRR
jgi:hypothetical protein